MRIKMQTTPTCYFRPLSVAFNVKHSKVPRTEERNFIIRGLKEIRTRGDYCDNGIYYKVAFDE